MWLYFKYLEHLSWNCTCFGSTYTKIGTIQRRLAWPLRKDDTQIREAFHIFRLRLPSTSCVTCNVHRHCELSEHLSRKSQQQDWWCLACLCYLLVLLTHCLMHHQRYTHGPCARMTCKIAEYKLCHMQCPFSWPLTLWVARTFTRKEPATGLVLSCLCHLLVLLTHWCTINASFFKHSFCLHVILLLGKVPATGLVDLPRPGIEPGTFRSSV